jgi:hypothetical protein
VLTGPLTGGRRAAPALAVFSGLVIGCAASVAVPGIRKLCGTACGCAAAGASPPASSPSAGRFGAARRAGGYGVLIARSGRPTAASCRLDSPEALLAALAPLLA